jgi:hypothetical protein
LSSNPITLDWRWDETLSHGQQRFHLLKVVKEHFERRDDALFMQGAGRAVSSVVGYALLLGIAVIGVTFVVVLGGTALTEIQQSAQAQQAGSAMSQFDAQAAQVALGSSTVQTVNLGSASGQVHVKPNAGWIQVEHLDGGTTETIVDTRFGAVVYDTGGATIAYQGGGVWRKEPSGGSMLSPPEYHYRGQTLTFPLIRITGDGWSGSPGTGLRIQSDGRTQEFPNATLSRQNPLETGNIHVTVTSEYHRGWASYFRTRTAGTVHHFPSNRTVVANLTVPFQVSFDNAVATTEAGSDAITTKGQKSDFSGPTQRNTSHPSADYRIEDRIAACESGGCQDLSDELTDGTRTLSNATYYEDGDITIGPSETTYDTSDGAINVVVDGDLTFKGKNGPGTTDHEITGGSRVTFYVKGDVEISGNGAVNTGGDPNDLLVLVHTGSGSVAAAKGTPQFTGSIYAPGSDLTIKGGGNIVGAVIVNTATAKGGGYLQHQESTIDFGLATGTEITYLHVSEQRITVKGS